MCMLGAAAPSTSHPAPLRVPPGRGQPRDWELNPDLPEPSQPQFLPDVSPAPTAVPGSVRFAAISAGGGQACGVEQGTSQGWCWGPGQRGQLGQGADESSAAPVPVAGGHSFAAISAGGTFSCCLDAQGAAWCW